MQAPGKCIEQLGTRSRAEDTIGAHESFTNVFRDHARYVAGQLLWHGVAAHDTDDVAQEVFLAAYTQLAELQVRSVRAWLGGVCRNKANDYHRKNERRRALFLAQSHLAAALEGDPHEQLVRHETVLRVRRSLSKLREAQRAVLALHELDDVSMREVAAQLGCSLNTAYTRHRTARGHIRELLERDERVRPFATVVPRAVRNGAGLRASPVL